MIVGDGTIWAISVSLRTVVSDASSLQLMCSALLVEMLYVRIIYLEHILDIHILQKTHVCSSM